ncbi:unnamed protein product [Phytomonas sp. EM1]|nr:unnamed protein product [Phytomonas sp. EM1]|eukprot:CCW60310.1 unnamed protein product [Phytomonas sp. isolate EM1]
MLSRAIHDIFHLKRLHAIVPDHSLGIIIKDKLCRLNLKPALQDLKSCTEQQLTPTRSRSGHWWDTSCVPDPSALCQLLECLAYFELGKDKVTTDAMQLVRSCLPSMNSLYLSKTLAASCALGQHDTSGPAIALLAAALRSGPESDLAASDLTLPCAATTTYVNMAGNTFTVPDRCLVHGGSGIILLMESLQRVDVHQEEVWSLVAEHCVRFLDSFDGKELFRIIELFYLEGLTYYPDFFVAAESHIARQPASFMPAELLQRVITYYKELGQPVVSLLSASSGRYADGFSTGLAVAAAKVRAVGGSNNKSRYGTKMRDRMSTNARPSSVNALERQGSKHDHSIVPESFVETASRTFSEVSAQELLELIQRCETKSVMHSDMVEAAVRRLEQLYFPDKLDQDAISQDPLLSKSKEVSSALMLSTSEFHCVSQCIHALLDFQDQLLFHGDTSNRISAMLDSLAQAPFPDMCRNRLLSIAYNTLNHLPAGTKPPSIFYKALIEHISRAKDISASESPERLRLLTSVLVALGSYGGHEVLNQYLPVLSVAVANTPRRTQIELAALLSVHPSACTELLPNLFRLIALHKKWSHQLTVPEVRKLLEAMTRTQTRSSHLVTGIVRFIQSQRSAIEPEELVRFMHSLVFLGFRDIDFFSSTTEHLLNAVSPVSRARASVHDLCEVLYTLTFVLKGVIRVVQQVLARLKISTSQVTPRDITLSLYSFVKLHVARHQDISGPFCDRAVAILSSFKPQELTSTLSSLRALNFNHTALITASYGVLLGEIRAREESSKRDCIANTFTQTDNSDLPISGAWPHHLQDDQFISMTATVIHLLHASATQHRENSKNWRGASLRESLDPDNSLQAVQHDKPAVDAVHTGIVHPLCDVELRDAFARISIHFLTNLTAQGTVPKFYATSANPNRFIGLQLYLVITTLAMFDPPVELSMGQWAMLAVLADSNVLQLQKGYPTTETSAAVEVLVALHKLRRTVTPDLPDEKESMGEWVAAVESWAATILPKLRSHVRDNSHVVLGDVKLKESLKGVGLLTEISQGVGEVRDGLFASGKPLGGASSRRSRSKTDGQALALKNFWGATKIKLSSPEDEDGAGVKLSQSAGDAEGSRLEGTLSGAITQWSENIVASGSQRWTSQRTSKSIGVHTASDRFAAPLVAASDGEVLKSINKEEPQGRKGVTVATRSSKKKLINRSSKVKPISKCASEFLI